MTSQELEQALRTYNFTQTGFARSIGVADRTVRAWIEGKSRIPGSVVVLFKMLHLRPELVHVMEEIEPPPVREHSK